MQKVVILSETEYDDLKGFIDAMNNRIDELSKVVDDKDKLQEYVRDWLS